jgi:hypothetical protein
MDYLFRFNQLRSNNRSTLGHYWSFVYDGLLDHLDYASSTRINQHRSIVDDRVAIVPDPVFLRNVVIGNARFRKLEGLGADSEEKHAPASDTDTAVVDSLKVLDPERPIREADILGIRWHVSKVPIPLQSSFCIDQHKFSGPYARRSNNHLRDYIILLRTHRRLR